MRRFVIIESPYAGDVETNLRYARAAMRDCLNRGEVPFASHALYTQPGVLDDNDPNERDRGIRAGFTLAEGLQEGAESAPHRFAFVRAFYTDLGWSRGMKAGLEEAESLEQPIEHRTIPGWSS